MQTLEIKGTQPWLILRLFTAYTAGKVRTLAASLDGPQRATGRFDFVLANPPFNVNAVDTAMRESARRHPEGTPQDLPARQDHERLHDMVGAN